MTYNQQLIKLTKDLVIDYEKFENKEIWVIGHPGLPHEACPAIEKFDYANWVNQHPLLDGIKVEGLEAIDEIRAEFIGLPLKNIHLFVALKADYSFDWHRDDVNVLIYVIKGQKVVCLEQGKVDLGPGDSLIIPKQQPHKVYNEIDTWSLSVGYE